MKKNIIGIFVILILLQVGNLNCQTAGTIGQRQSGQNFWYDATFYTNGNTQNLTEMGLFQGSGIKMVRIGGDAWNPSDAGTAGSRYQYSPYSSLVNDYVLEIKSRGCAPIVQVPVGDKFAFPTPPWTPAYAGLVVDDLNSAGAGPGTSYTQFFTIGNEPNAHNWTTQDVHDYTENFGMQMRASNYNGLNINNNIPLLIIGPGHSYFDWTNFQSKFVNFGTPGLNLISYKPNTVNANVTQARGVDFFSFHYYPFGDQGVLDNGVLAPTRTNMIATLRTSKNNPGGNPVSPLAANITTLRNALSAAPYYGKVKIAITEANVTYANATSGSAQTITNDSPSGNGTNSFIGGQFWAELMSVCFSEGVEILNFWSGKEGKSTYNPLTPDFDNPNFTGRSYCTNIGYINSNAGSSYASYVNSADNNKKPIYFHFQMIAQNLKEKYYPPVGLSPTTGNVKVFGAKWCGGKAIVVMNQDQASSYVINVNFNGSSPTPASGYIKAGLNFESNYVFSNGTYGSIAPEETKIFLFDGGTTLVKVIKYNQANASATPAQAPTIYNVTNPVVSCPTFNRVQNTDFIVKDQNMVCPDPLDNGTGHYNSHTFGGSSSTTLTGLNYVTGDLTIPAGAVLVLDSADVVFSTGSKLIVETGGILTVSTSILRSCTDSTWIGIIVKGDTTQQQIEISDSYILNAITGVRASKTKNVNISSTLFEGGNTAISLDSCNGFTISNNDIINCPYGIRTFKNYTVTALIAGNNFYNQDTCIFIDTDNLPALTIQCNSFSYRSYGIYSTGSVLQSQGNTSFGAGNIFESATSNVNSQFWHNGNSISYFHDPTYSFTLATSGSFAVTSYTASSDLDCTGGARTFVTALNPHHLEESKLFNCVPNPASSEFTINYSILPESKSAKVVVTSVIGTVYVEKEVLTGSTSTDVDISQISSGIYLYSLIIDGKMVGTKKLIISK